MKAPLFAIPLTRVMPPVTNLASKAHLWRVHYVEPEIGTETGIKYELKGNKQNDYPEALRELIAHLCTLNRGNKRISVENLSKLRIFINDLIEFLPRHDKFKWYEIKWSELDKKIVDDFLHYFRGHATRKNHKWQAQHYGYERYNVGFVNQTGNPKVLTPLLALIEHLAAMQRPGNEISIATLSVLTIFKDKSISYFPCPLREGEYQKFAWSDIDPKLVDAYLKAASGAELFYPRDDLYIVNLEEKHR